MRNKKGSHIEVVLSFVIFITFLTFLYFILEPAVKKPVSREYLLDELKPNLIDYISEEVSSYRLTIYFGADTPSCLYSGGNCFKISPSPHEGNASIKGGIDYYNNGSKDFSIKCDEACENGDQFDIYFAEEFEEGSLSTCDETNYGMTPDCYKSIFQKTKEYIFESKIDKLVEEYDSENMDDLKERLSISRSNGFWFNITDSNREQLIAPSSEEPDPEGFNVYSEEIPINYIGDDKDPENKKSGFLRIKIW